MIPDYIIRQAYENIHKRTGKYADQISSNPVLSMQFIQECYRLAGKQDPLHLPYKLMQMRKRGALPKKEEVRAALW
jgi:hypothetical protein